MREKGGQTSECCSFSSIWSCDVTTNARVFCTAFCMIVFLSYIMITNEHNKPVNLAHMFNNFLVQLYHIMIDFFLQEKLEMDLVHPRQRYIVFFLKRANV